MSLGRRIIALSAAFLISVSLMGQDGKFLHLGIDTSVDCFASSDNRISPSFGLGVRSRLGEYDQWLNLVGGVRYIYGTRLSGFLVPILLNVNLLKGRTVSGYLGAGFEFDFFGAYYGSAKFQTGLAGKHIDFRVFYKPYQGDLGVGATYYF